MKQIYVLKGRFKEVRVGPIETRVFGGVLNGKPYSHGQDPSGIDRVINYLINRADGEFQRRKTTDLKGRKPLYALEIKASI